MAKGNNDEIWKIIGIIALIFVIMWGYQNGKFGDIKNYFSTYNQIVPNPNNLPNEYTPYSVVINLVPTSICVGQTTTGSINSNIPNGVCSIFVKSGSGTWTFYSNANLDANGDYSAVSPILTIIGPINFVAVCCDAQGNCKMSNQLILNVNACGDNDGDGIPDNIDPDDDNDGYMDEEEIIAGTDPLDPNSHPTSGCNAQCVLEGYTGGRGPFVSGSECSYPEVIEYLSGESGLICCCTPSSTICYDSDSSLSPFEEQLKTLGYCSDSTASYTDHCYEGTNSLIEYYCSPTSVPQSEKSCDFVSYNCPGMVPGSHCDVATGRCVF